MTAHESDCDCDRCRNIRNPASSEQSLANDVIALTAERDALQADKDKLMRVGLNMSRKMLNVKDDNARLWEALERYGRHEEDCSYPFKPSVCDCGLDAVLTDSQKEGKTHGTR
jgi:hypothetical protein